MKPDFFAESCFLVKSQMNEVLAQLINFNQLSKKSRVVCTTHLIGYILYVSGIIAFFCLLIVLPAQRVGDGSEYYALAIAIETTNRPYMTDASWGVYTNTVAAERLGISAKMLKSRFPHLFLGTTNDFNHFWFYSIVPALIGKVGKFIGIDFSQHTKFLVFHSVLFIFLIFTTTKLFGIAGGLSSLFLSFCSPMFWFIDKVHTEFFTFVLITASVAYAIREKLFVSAILLALASTQNISFAPLSFICLVLGIYRKARPISFSFFDLLFVFSALIFCMLHPVYYFFRYGGFTPQLFGIGASTDFSAWRLLLWLFDPDVGLLPNWPIAGLFVSFAILDRDRLKSLLPDGRWQLGILLVSYLLINLIANSATTNLNHGATAGLSRYATWYIPLLFPCVLLLSVRFGEGDFSKSCALAISSVIAFLSITNILLYYPSKPQSYDRPSPISYFIQRYCPFLYNPPAEIFAERYAGVKEPLLRTNQPLAVVGPDCSKLLINRNGTEIYQNYGCGFDEQKLYGLIEEKIAQNVNSCPTFYYRLEQKEVSNLRIVPEYSAHYVFTNESTTNWLLNRDNWSWTETHGTWCSGGKCSVDLPCPIRLEGQGYFLLSLDLNAFLRPEKGHAFVDAKIMLDGKEIWVKRITRPSIVVDLSIPFSFCERDNSFQIEFLIANPISPEELGLSIDRRKLGIMLRSIRYERPP